MIDESELVKLAEEARSAAIGAVSHVSFANYAECEREAKQRVRNAFDKLDVALRRIASSDSGVKVRELEWQNECPSHYFAPEINVWHEVFESNGLWVRYFAGRNKDTHRTLDAAKAAAQADYEARIRSALVEVQAVEGEPEPVAWRDTIKQPDERPLPTYGQIPWAQLGRDVNDATFGRRTDFEFSDKVYPGHQMVLGINFNSLARIVDKYRYYGLPCVANTVTTPPADAGMREALEPFANAAKNAAWPTFESDNTLVDDSFGLTVGDLRRARKALTAPGATTKSDGGECACGRFGDGEKCPGVDGRPLCASSDPSSTRGDDVTAEELAEALCTACGNYWWQSHIHNPSNKRWIKRARALLDQFEIRRKS